MSNAYFIKVVLVLVILIGVPPCIWAEGGVNRAPACRLTQRDETSREPNAEVA